jgi:hypothetical protein
LYRDFRHQRQVNKKTRTAKLNWLLYITLFFV